MKDKHGQTMKKSQIAVTTEKMGHECQLSLTTACASIHEYRRVYTANVCVCTLYARHVLEYKQLPTHCKDYDVQNENTFL